MCNFHTFLVDKMCDTLIRLNISICLPAIIITEYHQDLILHLFDFSIQQGHGDSF